MDFELTEDHRALRAMCRDFAREVIEPAAEGWNRAHRFPCEVFRLMAGLDLCGPLVTKEYGGSDLGMVGYADA